MYRSILVTLLSAIILLVLAGLPAALPGIAMTGISGSAQAQKAPQATGSNLNSSKSNMYRQAPGGTAGGTDQAAGTTEVLPSTEIARAACEAKCRQDHQGNPAALEACKRGCDAVGAAGIAVSDPGSPADDAKPSKSGK